MTSKKVRTMLLSFAILLACLVTCIFGSFNPITAYASSITINGGYTDVLEDLKVSEDFDADSYKINEKDYSLQVITIAESEDKELFVYVYQPCTTLGIRATTINISTGVKDNLNYKNYKLKFVNSRGVFYKYVVEDFIVNNDEVRYYDISSIFRAWDNNLGDKNADAGTISEVPFAVGKQYTMSGYGKDVSCSCSDIELITITDKYVGFVRYYTMWADWIQANTDSHFVAFSTDKQIDKLMEADVYFKTQYHHYGRPTIDFGGDWQGTNDFGKIQEHYVTLNADNYGSVHGGWYGTYTWKRISTAEEFIASNNTNSMYNCGVFNVHTENTISEDGLRNIKDKQWVLQFYETEYRNLKTALDGFKKVDYEMTIVSDVTILRLAFETDGVYYNLGVVDNKMTGDGTPVNYTKAEFELTNAGKTLLSVLGFIILLLILWPILPLIFKFFAWLIKGIVKVICFPITAIKSISQKNKNKQRNKTGKGR